MLVIILDIFPHSAYISSTLDSATSPSTNNILHCHQCIVRLRTTIIFQNQENVPRRYHCPLCGDSIALPPLPEKPNNDNISDIRDSLIPLLLNLEYDMNGPHNLVRLIHNTATYTACWHNAYVVSWPALQPTASPSLKMQHQL